MHFERELGNVVRGYGGWIMCVCAYVCSNREKVDLCKLMFNLCVSCMYYWSGNAYYNQNV